MYNHPKVIALIVFNIVFMCFALLMINFSGCTVIEKDMEPSFHKQEVETSLSLSLIESYTGLENLQPTISSDNF